MNIAFIITGSILAYIYLAGLFYYKFAVPRIRDEVDRGFMTAGWPLTLLVFFVIKLTLLVFFVIKLARVANPLVWIFKLTRPRNERLPKARVL